MMALVFAACSSTGISTPASSADGTSSTAGSLAPGTTGTTVGPGSTTTTSQLATTATISGRPVAPDFTLELGDGGTYTLSEAAKPVYLVFWAEW